MMSAAILMMAGVELTKVRSVSDDLFSGQGELEDFSFAKSFNERVGVSTSSQGKNAADVLAIALPGLKGTTLTKQLEEVAGRSSGVMEESITAQEISVHSELKGVIADKIIRPQAAAAVGAQEKTTTNDAGAGKAEVPTQVKGAANDVLPESPIAYAAPVSGATDESLEPRVSIVVGDRPSVSTGDTPVVQKKTEAAEKVMEGASSKKPAKAQESSATPKTVEKTVGKIVDAIAVEPKPVMGVSTESAIPVVGQVVAPTVAPQSEVSKAADAFSKAVSAVTKPSAGTFPIAIDGQVHKEIASGAKVSVTDTAMMMTAGSDPVASPKTDMSPEKMRAVAIPGGTNGENKLQNVRESGATLLHSLSVVPTAVVSGDTPGELVPTKLLVGDAGGQTTGLPTGSREQDGAGVGAQSMDGAPRVLGATPTSLEVGIQNGTHGWLKVRAEMTDGGVVNASVSAVSSAGQEMLHRELPALTAYLQEEKVAVNAVAVHGPSAAGTDARSSSGTDGAGGQTPQRSNGGEDQHQNLKKAALNGSGEAMPYRSLHGVDEDGSLPLAAFVSGGSWLSVRA
jgi:hypothetical protein